MALHIGFKNVPIEVITINNPLFFSCCQRGRINLPQFPDAPEPLNSLLQDDTDGMPLFIHSDI